MTKNDLKKYGTALYGQHWKTAMARALGKNPRTIRRWDSGEWKIPDGILEQILALKNSRLQEIEKIK